MTMNISGSFIGFIQTKLKAYGIKDKHYMNRSQQEIFLVLCILNVSMSLIFIHSIISVDSIVCT